MQPPDLSLRLTQGINSLLSNRFFTVILIRFLRIQAGILRLALPRAQTTLQLTLRPRRPPRHLTYPGTLTFNLILGRRLITINWVRIKSVGRGRRRLAPPVTKPSACTTIQRLITGALRTYISQLIQALQMSTPHRDRSWQLRQVT